MNKPLMESKSWQIRHTAYGQSNGDFKLQWLPIILGRRRIACFLVAPHMHRRFFGRLACLYYVLCKFTPSCTVMAAPSPGLRRRLLVLHHIFEPHSDLA